MITHSYTGVGFQPRLEAPQTSNFIVRAFMALINRISALVSAIFRAKSQEAPKPMADRVVTNVVTNENQNYTKMLEEGFFDAADIKTHQDKLQTIRTLLEKSMENNPKAKIPNEVSQSIDQLPQRIRKQYLKYLAKHFTLGAKTFTFTSQSILPFFRMLTDPTAKTSRVK